MKRLAIVSVLMLSGCKFWVAGHTQDNGIVVHGTGVADPVVGTTIFNLAADGTDIKCTGESYPKPGFGQRAIVKIKCDDGRVGEGESWPIALDTGEGRGVDNCGNSYYMFFSTEQTDVDAKLAQYRKKMEESGNALNDKCDAQGDIPPHTDPLI